MNHPSPVPDLESDLRIAVILPCFNESQTIAGTIDAFTAALPSAQVVVCDNGSDDDTAAKALAAGARVISQSRPGKGNAMRRLMTEVDADIFVMADGDATYDATSAPAMIRRLLEHRLDMVVGRRVGTEDGQYRAGNVTANRLYTRLFCTLFNTQIRDLLSGYRVMSRRFVKTFPCASSEFEIETELNAHAAVYRLPVEEMDTPYHPRPEGSQSKLSRVPDGLRILGFFIIFLRDYAPLRVFGTLGLVLMLGGLAIAAPIIWEYFQTGLVERFPTWFASLAIILSGIIFVTLGFALESVSAARYQAFMASYQGFPFLRGRKESRGQSDRSGATA